MESLAKTDFARLDPTTHLPNRQQFVLDYRPAPHTQLVMMVLSGAQHFNQLLRAIGHEHAEEFARAGAARLREVVPCATVIYHINMLGFAFTMRGGATTERLQKIINAFHRPLSCGRIPITTEITLGITDCNDVNPAAALRAAQAAAHDSHDKGSDWSRYSRKTDAAHQRGFLLLSQLDHAMAAPDQLSLHFQPKYAMASGRPTSAEALLRWRHPVFGTVSPAEFIPFAEASSHIHSLTAWVLRHAIAQAGLWAKQELDLNIAINISPRNLTRRGFAKQVAAILEQHRVEPAAIELEFTEGLLIGDDNVLLEELQALRDTGIRIALDDFGTGFANFSYITHLPADIIKIDKSFIQKIGADPRSGHVVRSLIDLAHLLDYSVVAEGIETEKVYEMLASWNCDEGQGFLMSPPLDAIGFAAKISAPIRQFAH